MAYSATWQVEGFKELLTTLDAIREEIGKGKTDKIYRNAMKAAMQPILDAAKEFAPEDTGQLREHIYMKVHRPQRRDKNGKYFDGEVYMGRISVNPVRAESQLHHIVNKRGKLQTVWRNKKPVALSQEFGNAHTPKHGFLRRALEARGRNAVSILEMSLKLSIDEYARSVARGYQFKVK